MARAFHFSDLFSHLYIHLFTWQRGILVGTDAMGNDYYQERKPRQGQKPRRWVMYAQKPDAGDVPPEWHGWLHFNMNHPAPRTNVFPRPTADKDLPCTADTSKVPTYQAWTPR